jgi:hypothetical protein
VTARIRQSTEAARRGGMMVSMGAALGPIDRFDGGSDPAVHVS